MHVDVFVYGTLRTATGDRWPTIERFDPYAQQIGPLGGWVLPNRYMFCGAAIPAVTAWDTADGVVVGDLYRVTLTGFRALLRYENYPEMYTFEPLTVRSLTGDQAREAVVFTSHHANEFGDYVPSGDYFDHLAHHGGAM